MLPVRSAARSCSPCLRAARRGPAPRRASRLRARPHRAKGPPRAVLCPGHAGPPSSSGQPRGPPS
eukprot:11417399-Alexandrium_andersonii.AAC.1